MSKKRRKKGTRRPRRRCGACGADVVVTVPRAGVSACVECIRIPRALFLDFVTELRRIEGST